MGFLLSLLLKADLLNCLQGRISQVIFVLKAKGMGTAP